MSTQGKNLGLKLLALLLAGIIWGSVHFDADATVSIKVPVVFINLESQLMIGGTPPQQLDVMVAGPKIMLAKLRPDQLAVKLDLAGVKEGTAAFCALDKQVRLRPGLRIVRVFPSTIEVRLQQKL